MTYIHELSDWPKFTWNSEAIAAELAAVRNRQGRHLGRMEGLGFDIGREASLSTLTSDVVQSSAIEGERLDAAEVRSSIARKLGLDVRGMPRPDRGVEGIVQMALDATQNYDQPLTADRLFGWHGALFPTGRSGLFKITVGAWRDDHNGPMQVVSGPVGRERVHYQAPAADRLETEMKRFLDWFNQPPRIDPVLKAALAHLWFVTIHPFDDGNGRIARAIADMALARADETKNRYYSMSSAIEAEKKDYYVQLESAQRGSLNISSWMAWFLGCLGRALDSSVNMLASVMNKANLWQLINLTPVNERQRLVINRLLEPEWDGFLTNRKYAALAKCSRDTALRDISELIERGILIKNEEGGRSTSYRLARPDELQRE